MAPTRLLLYALEGACLVLTLGLALKCFTILRAIHAISSDGRVRELLRTPVPRQVERGTTSDIYLQRLHRIDETRAGFWPFGLKDYRLRRWIYFAHVVGGPSARLAARAAEALRVTLFQLHTTVPLAALADVLITFLAAGASPGDRMTSLFLVMANVFTGLLALLLIGVEGIYCFNALGSYATAFHRLSRNTPGAADSPNMLELGTFVVTGALIFLLAAAGNFAVASDGQIAGISADPSVGSLFDAIYHTIALSIFGERDFTVDGTLAKLVVIAVSFLFLEYLVVFISLLNSSRGGGR